MLKIAVIIPGELDRKEFNKRIEHINKFVSSATKVKGFLFKGDIRGIKTGADVSLLANETMKLTINAEKQGFDAVVIHGICDFGIEAARGAVDIPVVGLGSATFHLACQLADRFGVVTKSEATIPEFSRRIQLMGCFNRITSMRALNIPELELKEQSKKLRDRFIEIARYQIKTENAQLIIAGYSAIFSALEEEEREKIEKTLGVPVLDGVSIAMKTAEMLIELKLCHSHKAYPKSEHLPIR
jgi:allantoin racemase